VAQEQREQRPLARPTHVHRRAVQSNLERPKDPELDTSAHVPSPQVSRNTAGLGSFSRVKQL
jgi:hypothetical protein